MRHGMLGKKPSGFAGPASVKEVKKMTFEEWWCSQGFDTDSQARRWKHDMFLCWKAAQENK